MQGNLSVLVAIKTITYHCLPLVPPDREFSRKFLSEVVTVGVQSFGDSTHFAADCRILNKCGQMFIVRDDEQDKLI